MLELGRWAEPLHRDVGNYVAECGIAVLVGIRGAARHMVDAAMRARPVERTPRFFSTIPEAAGDWSCSAWRSRGDAILFKGSRGIHVETALREVL